MEEYKWVYKGIKENKLIRKIFIILFIIIISIYGIKVNYGKLVQKRRKDIN